MTYRRSLELYDCLSIIAPGFRLRPSRMTFTKPGDKLNPMYSLLQMTHGASQLYDVSEAQICQL